MGESGSVLGTTRGLIVSAKGTNAEFKYRLVQLKMKDQGNYLEMRLKRPISQLSNIGLVLVTQCDLGSGQKTIL